MLSGPGAFEAVCVAIGSPHEPLRRLITALEANGAVPGQYHRLVEHASAVTFRVAAEGAWTRAHNQFEVVLGLGPEAPIEIVLPSHFASPAAAAALYDRTGYESIYDVRRLRHMIGIVLSILLLRRVDLVHAIRERVGPVPARITLIVSCEDHCDDDGVLALSRHRGHTNILLPDPFFFDLNGYERHKLRTLAARQPWQARSDVVVWRGSTTGSRFALDDLLRNERIALCAACAERPDLFDVKISGVVQAPASETAAVTAALEARGLLGGWTSFDALVDHKFALHIDGNSSAAGFLEKLCLGCCVFQVESRFEQWYETRLQPWTHYVPVGRDAGDVVDKVSFVRRNPDLAERIAQAGFAFALGVDMPSAAASLVRDLAASFPVDRFHRVLRAPADGDDAIEGWHHPERHPDGTLFRWTDGREVGWDLDLPAAEAGLLTVEIPFVEETGAGFAAASHVVVGDVRRSVRVLGGSLRAEVPVAGSRPLRLLLQTPPPIVPAERGASDDTRALALAIRM